MTLELVKASVDTSTKLSPVKVSPYHSTEPLFSFVCDEPNGPVERKVYLATFTPIFLRDMWEKQRKFRTLMGREILTFSDFVDFFVMKTESGKLDPKGICLVIDDLIGIYWISDINYPAYCEVHYTFFDGRHRGRLELTKQAIKYIFNFWQINLMYVNVALYAKLPIRFVESLGFKKEGRLRSRFFYRDKWWDVNSYSLLKEEING
jgi:RimJ/RimL family protein N-acetyltransferase